MEAAIFIVGGLAFCVGTAVYYFDAWPPAELVAAALYTVGASMYLSVDLYGVWTSGASVNRALSVAGTAFYVVGSVGFMPAIYTSAPALGNWCYILGSVLVCTSQLWKARRLVAGERDRAGVRTWCSRARLRLFFVDLSIELSAALGAFCWLIGALLLVIPFDGDGEAYWAGVGAWMTGSISFTAGAVILALRPAYFNSFCAGPTASAQRTVPPGRSWKRDGRGQLPPLRRSVDGGHQRDPWPRSATRQPAGPRIEIDMANSDTPSA
ncbi:hypothetical protein T492DRAFT_981930 [Pavlovales sp. CCMP2436]|nr:hypothetical protein T492DRAFT_981930 [Pavlovales sp. CCMP2436]|mmetsp:Transcript_43067/g.106279  ORF Transcript_43067/g.106279 Transcript_43067/m.106279 type:complete len:267 (+) Transcript_43067:118-918(+)